MGAGRGDVGALDGRAPVRRTLGPVRGRAGAQGGGDGTRPEGEVVAYPGGFFMYGNIKDGSIESAKLAAAK